MRSRSSRRRIVWLSADGDTPSRAAARVKLRSFATTAYAARLPQSSRSILENLSIPHSDYPSLLEVSQCASLTRLQFRSLPQRLGLRTLRSRMRQPLTDSVIPLLA